MSNILTSNRLIESIKRRAMIPEGPNTFNEQDFLDMLNEEIQHSAVPQLLRTHEEYLLTYVDIPLTPNTIRYSIPSRAIGNKLRDIAYVEPNELLRGGGTFYEMARVDVEALADYRESYTDNFTNTFYVEGDEIVLIDSSPATASALRMYFYLRPNTIVTEDKAGIITGIDRTTGVITLDKIPSAFSSLPLMDFVQSKNPNTTFGLDAQPTAVNSNTNTMTFNVDDIPERLSVGDYLNVAGEAIVPQIPVELHPLLTQRVAVHCLEALGDTQALQVAQVRLDRMEKSTNDLIDNRVEGAPQKIVNRHSALRNAISGIFRGSRRRGKL
jgi:hypothetical protein